MEVINKIILVDVVVKRGAIDTHHPKLKEGYCTKLRLLWIDDRGRLELQAPKDCTDELLRPDSLKPLCLVGSIGYSSIFI